MQLLRRAAATLQAGGAAAAGGPQAERAGSELGSGLGSGLEGAAAAPAAPDVLTGDAAADDSARCAADLAVSWGLRSLPCVH